MPAPNLERRELLADTAVELLARDGAHGLTHRALERAAGLPTGTASNYFPTRTALFVAAATRVIDEHRNDMDAVASRQPLQVRTATTQRRLIRLITDSLLEAATEHRTRYLAIYELWAESRRQPGLRPALLELQDVMTRHTVAHHRRLGLTVAHRQAVVLMQLYGAVLHDLVLRDPHTLDRPAVSPLAAAIVRGVLAE